MQGQGSGIMVYIQAGMGQGQEYQVAWWLAHIADQAITIGNLAQAKAAAHIIEVQLTSMANKKPHHGKSGSQEFAQRLPRVG